MLRTLLHRVTCCAAAMATMGLAPPSAAGQAEPVAASGSPAAATPNAPPSDTVRLRDGSFVRGRIIAFERERSVTLLVPGTEQPRVIPWGQVAELRRGNQPPPSARPPAAPTAATAAAQAAPTLATPRRGAPQVLLEVRGNREVTLFEVAPENEWGTATAGVGAPARDVMLDPRCKAPCDEIIDGRKGQSFVVGGPRVSPSKPFQLLDRGGAVTLHVTPRPQGFRLAAWTLTPLGVLLAPVGVLMVTNPFREPGEAVDDDLRTGGYVAIGVAGAAVIGGVLLAVFSRTKVRFRSGRSARP
ncbi:MAG: hypothetical protein B7733_20640 [Myxococcales bacterium FL481]|nr:MAG: hypothetical protein B7733_20640 [Myxococcales bacterium FL481]